MGVVEGLWCRSNGVVLASRIPTNRERPSWWFMTAAKSIHHIVLCLFVLACLYLDNGIRAVAEQKLERLERQRWSNYKLERRNIFVPAQRRPTVYVEAEKAGRSRRSRHRHSRSNTGRRSHQFPNIIWTIQHQTVIGFCPVSLEHSQMSFQRLSAGVYTGTGVS